MEYWQMSPKLANHNYSWLEINLDADQNPIHLRHKATPTYNIPSHSKIEFSNEYHEIEHNQTRELTFKNGLKQAFSGNCGSKQGNKSDLEPG